MRKTLLLLLLAVLLILSFSPALAEDEEEEDVSFYELLNPPTSLPVPQADATPAPTPVPGPTPTPVIQADGSIEVTITAVGDVTIGRNVQKERKGNGLFDRELKKHDGDINFIFRNVKTIFQRDDLTIANFEGVLADSYTIPSKKKNNEFLFIGEPDYAKVLSDNSVELVTMENNHAGDFGDQGVSDTIAAIEKVGVQWANKTHMATYEAQGVRIAVLAYQTLNQSVSSKELANSVLPDVIAAARQTHDLVIVAFHWGEEKDYSPRDNQIMLGRAAIDAGADLVLGHHSHRINPIEQYKGKYIVYSLGNCSFSGHNKPSDMLTFIFQTRFRFRNGELFENTFRIIPCRISSRKDYNDFAITPLTDNASITTVINTLKNKQNTKKLDYAVEYYPLEWE